MKLLPLLALLVACGQAKTQYSTEEVREDIEYLHQQLEDYHPGFYRYTDKEEMDAYFLEAKQSEGLDDYGLYRRVNFLVSQIGCGHTRARMSDEMRAKFEREQRFLPLSVKFLGEKVYVRQSLDEKVPVGSEIKIINQKPIDEIKQQIYKHLPADGVIETGKERFTEWLFDAYYQLYIDTTATSYQLKIIDADGASSQVEVEGVSIEQMEAIRASFSGDLLSMEYAENHAYMRIRTFSDQSLRSNGYNYERFLSKSFKELKTKGTKNLILDLRGNGGGRDDYGALLVSYLAREPYGYFDRIEVTKNYPGNATRIGDTYHVTSHNGLSTWQPDEDRFEGKVYVLIDGFSFSTCADVATVLHHHGWATFLGQETGGGYDGNTSGHSKTITLPNSGITLNLPMWMYTTANIGHAFPGRGVIPDYEVDQTWTEFSDEYDTVLEKVKKLIGGG